MRYEKPEVTSLGSAVASIHGSTAKDQTPNDSNHEPTISAYEADE